MDDRTPEEDTTKSTTADSSEDDTADKMEWEDLPTDLEPASVESPEPASGFATGGRDVGTTAAIPEKSAGEILSPDKMQLAGTSQHLPPIIVSLPLKEKSSSGSKIKSYLKKFLSPKKKDETETQSGTNTSPPNRSGTVDVASTSSKPGRMAKLLGILSPKGKTEASKKAEKSPKDRSGALDDPASSSKQRKFDAFFGVPLPERQTEMASTTASSRKPPLTFKQSEPRYTFPSDPSYVLTELSEITMTSSSSGQVFEDEAEGTSPLKKSLETEVKQRKISTGEQQSSPQKRTRIQTRSRKGSLETDDPTSDSSKLETDDGLSETTAPKVRSSCPVFSSRKTDHSVPSQLETSDDEDTHKSPSKRRKTRD